MTKEIRNGSRVARIVSNDVTGPFWTTLWVNNGETITSIRKTAQTLKGAIKQAEAMVR